MSTKRRFYILLVSRDEDGSLRKVPIPLRYAYSVAAVAAIGLFTITGLAGSYSRMLIKTARFNQLRNDHDVLQKDYAHLAKQARDKDIQAASLGSLASEVSALYGLTTSKLAGVGRGKKPAADEPGAAKSAGTTALPDFNSAGLSDDGYANSLESFSTLRTNAMSGTTTRMLENPGWALGQRGIDDPMRALDDFDGAGGYTELPSLWPISGPITSSFGEREDPVLGNGEGEFHTGIDIGATQGTPIHATAAGVVESAEGDGGYGRMVAINHGHGVVTMYGHMSGFAVTAGQHVARGQVIGYVGHSGRTTGNHVHYEVRVHNTPVNPHKYLKTTLAQVGMLAGE